MLAILFLLLAPATSNPAELKQETLTAWNEYIRRTNLRLEESLSKNGRFLWTDEVPNGTRRVREGEILVSPVGKSSPEKVSNGLIHDWVGAVFIPKATIGDILSVVHDYNRYKEFYGPTVIDSRLIGRSGEEYKFLMLGLKRVLFETIVLQGEFESRCSHMDGKHVYCSSQSTRLQEIQDYGQPDARKLPPDMGHGYLWRLYSVTKFEERDGGVYVELEAIALSRDISAAVRWLMKPVVQRVSRKSISTVLQRTRDAVRSRVSVHLLVPKSPPYESRASKPTSALSILSCARASPRGPNIAGVESAHNPFRHTTPIRLSGPKLKRSTELCSR